MTKKNKKIILITSMITILPILAGLILWNKLPAQVATHFDFNGIPNATVVGHLQCSVHI